MGRAGILVWPSAEQEMLLKAGLLDGAEAIEAFRSWRARVRLEDDFSPATARLLPLAYRNLHQLGVTDVIMQRLKGVYRHSWYVTQRLLHAVTPVASTLRQAGIPVLLTKGAPMALAYYRNIAVRPMADVDLVVPRSRIEDALGILVRMGWRGEWPGEDALRFRHALPWFGPEGAAIDLHWRPMYETPPDSDDGSFFASAEPLDIRDVRVLQPDPTRMLFLTVIHGMRFNRETPVRWIADAITVIRSRNSDIDWDLLHELARSHRVVPRLRRGLSYIDTTFQAPVPAEVLERLASTRTSLFERFESRVALSDDGTLRPSVFRSQMSWLAEYGRNTRARNPISFVAGYTHYCRYRLGLSGRRELFPRIVQALRRRLTGRSNGSSHAAGPRS